MTPDEKTGWLLAEYCDGPFYTGWWLYFRDRPDGSENDDRWNRWGWLRDEWQLKTVHEFLVSLGHDAPPSGRYSQDLAEWFGEKFPGGIKVHRDRWGQYTVATETEPTRSGWDLVVSRPLSPEQEAAADELARVELDHKATKPKTPRKRKEKRCQP